MVDGSGRGRSALAMLRPLVVMGWPCLQLSSGTERFPFERVLARQGYPSALRGPDSFVIGLMEA